MATMEDRTGIQATLARANGLLDEGRDEEAYGLYVGICQGHPESAEAWSGLAVACLRQERYPECVQAAVRAMALEPRQPRPHLIAAAAFNGMGRTADAIQAADAALAIEPDNVQALNSKAGTLLGRRRHAEVLPLVERALQIEPSNPGALLHRGVALHGLGQSLAALECFDQLLALQPDHANALMNRSSALIALGRPEEALRAAEDALRFQPDAVIALLNRTAALLSLRRPREALATADRLLLRNPRHIKGLINRTIALLALSNFKEALATTFKALTFDSFNPDLLELEIQALLGLKRFTEAVAKAQKAWSRYPDRITLRLELASGLMGLGELARAETHVDAVLASVPGQPDALALKFEILLGRNEREATWSWIEQALVQYPGQARLWTAKSAILLVEARYAEALVAAERALALDPDQVHATINRIVALVEGGNWDDYDAVLNRAKVLIEQSLAEGQPTPLPPFKSLVMPFPPELHFAIARSQGDFLWSGMMDVRRRLAFAHPASCSQRLKIGYVSADFRNHPTAQLMRGLFQSHDRKRFEIYAYALCKDDHSSYYQQIKADAEQFVDLSSMTNADAASRIHRDGIHVLIDLMGYTAYARSEIFALQPAPVQVSYLGYPGTMGASFIPYIIVDPVVLPEDLQTYFTEQPVYLPNCYQVNDRWQEIAETGIQRRDAGLPEEVPVFCCFNMPSKLEPVMFAVWTRILKQVPGSVLWLLASELQVAANLRRAAERHGIGGERLIFAERLPKDRHLERHRLADLFLDTRLYNAHTTASDALWAGLPVLTCIGETFPARVAASLLQAVGMPELIAHSLAEYEELAVRLATHPSELAALREKLAYNRLRTPLFDTERFARHLEQVYEMMWERHIQGLPPAPLWVAPLLSGP